MKYIDPLDIVDDLPRLWAADDPRTAARLARAAASDPRRMRRVHDLASLLLGPEGLRAWLRAPDDALGGVAPIEVLAVGVDGVRLVDERLMAAFRACAPREVFPLEGHPADPSAVAAVLARVLLQRREPGDGGALHHPVSFQRREIVDAATRLASAITVVAAEDDGPEARACVVLGMADAEAEVRAAAAAAAGGLLGFPEVAAAVEAAADDPSAGVRLAALTGAARFAGAPEGAGLVARFAGDSSVALRVTALAALRGCALDAALAASLAPLGCDPDPRVRALAEEVVGAKALAAWQRAVAASVAAGAPASPFELAAVAGGAWVGELERREALIGRLQRLGAERIDAAGAAAVLRALGAWRGGAPDAVWADAWRAVAGWDEPAFERALLPALQRQRSDGAWELTLGLLCRPVAPGWASLRVGLADVAADAAGTGERLASLASLAQDRALEPAARAAVVWSLRTRAAVPVVAAALSAVVCDAEEAEPVVEAAVDALAAAGAGAAALSWVAAHGRPGPAAKAAAALTARAG